MGFIKKIRKMFNKKLENLKSRECDLKTIKMHRELFSALYKMRLIENAVNVGQKLPLKEVKDILGNNLNIEELLQKGPVVLKFYRGSWCNYCETDLSFLHDNYNLLEAEGATAIAIATQPKEAMIENAERNGYRFHSVSDTDKSISKMFGLLFKIPDAIIQAYQREYKIDTEKLMGSSKEVALPATYVIDKNGDVVYASMNEDFRTRASIDEVIHYVKKAKVDKKKYISLCQEEECKIRTFINGVKGALKKSEEKRASRTNLKDERGSIHSLTLSEFSKDPLGYCLQNPEFLESFKDYLNKTYCMENLLFYMETRDFEANWLERTEEERKAEVKRIFETFVKPGSELEVNLDDTTRDLLVQAMTAETVSADFYEKAGREIYILMESDSFTKWKRTRDYATLWKKEGSIEFLSPVPVIAEAA